MNKNWIRALAAALAGASAALAFAKDVVLTDGPEAAVHVAPANAATRRFRGIDGDSSVAAPTWFFAQWGIPTELRGGARVPAGSAWQVANDYARVAWLPATRAYELAQNGNQAAPACGAEEDLFLSPTTADAWPGYAVGLKASRTLSQLDSLVAVVGLDIAYEQLVARCTGSPNYAAYLVAVVLSDNAQPQPQTLYYQVILRDSRNIAIAKSWCPGYESADTPVFCVDDGLAQVYGQPAPVVGGGRRPYSLDLLPQLRNVIASRHAKAGHPQQVLDADPAHWRVTGLYYGQLVMGGAVPTSRWDSFSLRQSW